MVPIWISWIFWVRSSVLDQTTSYNIPCLQAVCQQTQGLDGVDLKVVDLLGTFEWVGPENKLPHPLFTTGLATNSRIRWCRFEIRWSTGYVRGCWTRQKVTPTPVYKRFVSKFRSRHTEVLWEINMAPSKFNPTFGTCFLRNGASIDGPTAPKIVLCQHVESNLESIVPARVIPHSRSAFTARRHKSLSDGVQSKEHQSWPKIVGVWLTI